MKKPSRYFVALALSSYLAACATPGHPPEAKKPDADISLLITGSLLYARQGKLERARSSIQQALVIDADSVDANNIAGLIYGSSGQADLAIKHFEKALSIAGNDAATLNNYGNFLCEAGKTRQAEEKFLQAANQAGNPSPEIAYTNAGLCAMRVPDPPRAAEHFNRALNVKKNNSIALFQLAQINFNNKRGAAALRHMQTYARFAQHTPQTLKLGMQIGRLIKDKQVEVSYFNLLQNQFPASKEYQWALTALE